MFLPFWRASGGRFPPLRHKPHSHRPQNQRRYFEVFDYLLSYYVPNKRCGLLRAFLAKIQKLSRAQRSETFEHIHGRHRKTDLAWAFPNDVDAVSFLGEDVPLAVDGKINRKCRNFRSLSSQAWIFKMSKQDKLQSLQWRSDDTTMTLSSTWQDKAERRGFVSWTKSWINTRNTRIPAYLGLPKGVKNDPFWIFRD